MDVGCRHKNVSQVTLSRLDCFILSFFLSFLFIKRKSEDVLIDVNKELQSLATAVKDIAIARNSTQRILNVAYEIGNMTMPISLQEIQELSIKIQNTAINEGMINTTFADAQIGLTKAQEVQKRSKDAL